MDGEINNKNENRRKSDRIRLDSWKAIANYVKRSVRTVRRWESMEGFPVRRHQHKKGFSVYAYAHEIDEWLISGRHSPQNATSDRSVQGPSRHVSSGRMLSYVAVSFVTLAVGLLAGTAISTVGRTPDANTDLQTISMSNAGYWPESHARTIVSPVYLAWSEGRMADVFDESRLIRRQLEQIKPTVRQHVIKYLFEILLTLGRADDARALLAELPDGGDLVDLEAQLLLALSDDAALESSFALMAASENPTTILILSLVGKADDAVLSTLSKNLSAAEQKVVRAIPALQSGDVLVARDLLQGAVTELVVEDRSYYFVALDMLAETYRQDGRLDEAIGVLERTTMKSSSAAHNGSGLFWLMCQRQLARLYREADRDLDAAELESVLRKRLALADPTFPLAVSLFGA